MKSSMSQTTPRRSVFPNYTGPTSAAETAKTNSPAKIFPEPDLSSSPHPLERIEHLDVAVPRAFLYRFISQAFDMSDSESWHRIANPVMQSVFLEALKQVAPEGDSPLRLAGESFLARLTADGFSEYLDEYVHLFGHAARGECPINEMEYGESRTDPLLQPHRLADLSAFYHAHGLEIAGEAGEREDHLCIELEFMSTLAAKEAWVLQNKGPAENRVCCREAQHQFLREHLGRWAPAFARRLISQSGNGPLGDLGKLTLSFLMADCERFGVAPGSGDLSLRPVDSAAESLCSSCGLSKGFPGAFAPQDD
jgi:putative dimethyl sulfoxide reductase chaperone